MKYVYRFKKMYFSSHKKAWEWMDKHHLIGDGNALKQGTYNDGGKDFMRTTYLNGFYIDRIELN